MKNDKTLYLIDGSAYIYRAYHAIRSLANSKGLPTNAAFGFTRMLIKLIEDRSPEYVVLNSAPSFSGNALLQLPVKQMRAVHKKSCEIFILGSLNSQVNKFNLS